MSIIRPNELPPASGITNDDIFIVMDDPSGNKITKKISFADLASAIGGGGGGSTFDAAVEWTANHTLVDGTRYLANDLVYSSGNLYRAKFDNESLPVTDTTYWENVGPGYRLNIDGRDIPNIPNPFDQDLNTTNFPTFSGINLSNNSTLAPGTYDSGYGGNNGISLNCVVGYELNWQGGHLKSTYNNGANTATLYVDSPTKHTQVIPTVSDIGIVQGLIDTDTLSAQIFDMVVEGATTLNNPTNATDGVSLRWRITQDSNGNRPITLDTKFNLPSSSTPLVWSTTPGATDLLAATYDASRDKWDIVAFITGY